MWQLDPCNWKCTSSVAQRSTSPAQAISRSFYIFPLFIGIGTGDFGPRLSETKPKLPEHTLALKHPQCDAPLAGNKLGERLSVPKIGKKPAICWTLSESKAKFLQLLFAEPSRSPGSFSFTKAGKAFFFELTHPIGNCSRGVSKEFHNVLAVQALSYKEDSVQAVIVARFTRALDFVLQGDLHIFTISKFGSLHDGITIPPWNAMGNY